ncbi:MAG: GtrA family protein [Caulobacteraceae bacterium]
MTAHIDGRIDGVRLIERMARFIERRTGGFVPGRFVMFAAVGASGLAVHAATLLIAAGPGGLPLWIAQACAIILAMVSNFSLNNLITFRDLRLQGKAWWRGLAGFALACGSGAVISQIAAVLLNGAGAPWLASGLGGALIAATWNYWSASRAAWNAPAREREAV